MSYLKQLKKVIHQAMSYGYIDRDPFTEFKTTYRDPNRAFLTQEELKTIEDKEIKIERLRIVKDIFLFMCYTGLSYADLAKLTSSNISIGIDGEKWIISERNKLVYGSVFLYLQKHFKYWINTLIILNVQ